MKSLRTFTIATLLCLSFFVVPGTFGQAAAPEEVNLLSWSNGVLIVQAPLSQGSAGGQWSDDAIIDEVKSTGWANPRNDMTPKTFIFEFAGRSQVSSLMFDTAQADEHDRSAKEIVVAIADTKDGNYTELLRASLTARQDGQKFPLKSPAQGRYLKLTVSSSYGDTSFMEIMNFYAFGHPVEKRTYPDFSGTYDSNYGKVHMQQNGTTVNGCYDYGQGLIENGALDGRVLRTSWSSNKSSTERWGGLALFVFSDDGQTFTGHYWYNANTDQQSSLWLGKRISKQIGSCPNWKPGGNAVEQQLKAEGRVRLYGIFFDTDSDHIKPESKPTLDAILAAAHDQPAWNFLIEGHTDNTGNAAHNQTLSDQRAASVKAYLVKAGIDPGRLTTQGFGATKPAASNDTSTGRSQNRRVEIVKK